MNRPQRKLRRGKGLLLPALLLAVVASSTAAAETAISAQRASQGVLFTTPLLSETEQAEYRARVRAAKSAAEAEQVRAAHYELMKARARERGVALPEQRPPALGVGGNSFGPNLINEEERAAQRNKTRGVRKPQAAGAPARQEQAEAGTRIAPPRPSISASPAGVAVPSAAASSTPVAPNATPPAATPPATPPATHVVLPGIANLFGPELMSEEERGAYRARLRSARSDEERRRIRAERDEQMRLRAKENGVTLPQ